MKIIRKEDHYEVESSKKGKFYKVNPHMPMCDCPHFLFREIKKGGECKHIVAVRDLMAKEGKDVYSDIMGEAAGWTDTIELMDRYGEDAVQNLIDRGELMESKGRVKKIG
ncbi:hypothetical protein GF351_05935 [Candidatus Woesearchaeota archaeon]|nr:hypothetical protein [Candidatus Woesearchaeota archaeon]